ncbi:hypothetical protein BD626DRAFT_633262, partial [Schizophyllum amplum]
MNLQAARPAAASKSLARSRARHESFGHRVLGRERVTKCFGCFGCMLCSIRTFIFCINKASAKESQAEYAGRASVNCDGERKGVLICICLIAICNFVV